MNLYILLALPGGMELFLFVLALAFLILIVRLLGSWMLRIIDLISLQKKTNQLLQELIDKGKE